MRIWRSVPWILLFLFGVWAGCSRGEGPRGRETAGVELTYWPAPNQQEVQLAESLVAVWSRLHPDITVRMQPIPVSQSTEEVLLAAIAGGTTPDVCSNIWPGALHDYTTAGGLVPLDRFPDFDSVAAARIPADLLATFRSPDGHYYQLPWKTNPIMMFYNRRLLEEAGVRTVPRTYGDYLAAGARVSRDTNGDGQIDVWMGERDIRPIWWQRRFDFFPFYIAASGGKTLFSGTDMALDPNVATQVFAFFRACYERRYFPRTFFQGADPFLLEKKATHFAGPWQVATIEKFSPGMRFGVVPLPVPDGQNGPVYTYGDFKNIAIFSNTRHPRESWEFVKFLIRAENDLKLLEIARQLPIRGDLLTNPLFEEYFQHDSIMTHFAEQVPYTRGDDATPDLKEIFDALSQAYESCAVYGRIEPAQAVADFTRHAQLIVEWNR